MVRYSLKGIPRVLLLPAFALVMGLALQSCKEKTPAPGEVTPPAGVDMNEAVSGEEPDPGALWTPYDDSLEVAANADHPLPRMRYKLIQSRVLDKNAVFSPLYPEVRKMTEADYSRLKPLILEKSIPEVQAQIKNGDFSYEDLCRFFLYRIYKYELDPATTLNTIIALNPNLFREARRRDSLRAIDPAADLHPIFGMPVLLKDNINTEEMPTTAGAIALMGNRTGDAFIVERLKEKGAIIMGKVNLSEWAYYMCRGCPVGYSAVGGQTLNPYGRRLFETGGSSSGSGTAIAAGYAMAAVGTETSGSILSPSSQNSVVGLKPTVGMLSRRGIVPISSTLDTPGPMTRNVTDTGILLDALMGYDPLDMQAFQVGWDAGWYLPGGATLRGKRLGVFRALMESDSLYRETVSGLEAAGAEVIPFDPPEVELEGFLTLLNLDMREDLPAYLNSQIRDTVAVGVRSVADVVAFNRADTLLRVPYGQALLEGILADSTGEEAFEKVRSDLRAAGRRFFTEPWEAHRLDAVLSVNNYHAGYAAVARYPALTVPMGYRESGEPTGLTFIGKPFQIPELLRLAHAFEQLGPARRMPAGFTD
ncbi:amidase family protein [Robiginitalea marina]|uniref:Amidase family protein n=1 Tax=Robiginitalea marina TaxID=2954105 RepID=A0ABT1AZN6_9FLAO|nr:amidase family protein [Robiginitalea marina]MCO5725481.1 amidase family protein [Robiginitalea marina]